MSKALATKNVAAILVAAALVVGFSFAYATTAKAQTMTTTSTASYTFTINEKLGSRGAEVMQIQKFLNSNGFTVASTGAGSTGNETTYFGAATKKAVMAFQRAKNVSPVSGYWGPLTRAAANAVGGTTTTTGGTTGGTTTTGPGITVSAAAQPANSLAPKGTSRVPLTTFTLTNNTSAAVTITGVQIQRTGLAQDAVFSGVILVDQNGLQVGVSRTFDSNHQTTVGDTFTIAAGSSQTYTVAGNMAASLTAYAGQVVGVSVIGVNTTVPVTGSLPITGAQQTINDTLTTGTVTTGISSFDPNAPLQKHIGDTAVRFTGVRFTAGSAEDIKMYSIRFRLNGSVGPTDLSNLVVNVNGTTYPTTWASDGRYVTAVFAGGVLITKGNSADVYLQGDITGSNASGRVAEFDIDRTSDVYFVGQTYGYGIQPVLGSVGLNGSSTHGSLITNSQPFFQASTVTIQGGTATTISNAPEVPAANVALNVSNQPLGGFDANFTGEPVTVQSMVFTVTGSGIGATDNLRSVSLVNSNGAVVAGPVDATGNGASQTLTFSNSVTFPTGLHTYTLKGTVPADYVNGSTIQISTTPSSGWTGTQGQLTGNSISLSGNGSFNMNTMTVRAASLVISAAPTPSANTIVAGGQKILLGQIQLDASQSGEDIRVSSLPINVTVGTTSAAAANLSACQLWNGTTALNNNTVLNTVASGANTFVLDNALTIPKGTTLTVGVTCNLSSSALANQTYQFGVAAVGQATGATSGNTVTPTLLNGASSNSGVQTVQSGATLTVSVDSSSPSYAIAAGGTAGVNMGVIKLHPTNEAVNLTKLGLTLTSGAAADVTNVYLYSGSTLIGTASFNGTGTSATSTLTSALNLPVNTDTLITVKADLAQIGIGQSGTEGNLIKIDPLNFEGTGVSSGTAIRGGATPGVQGVRLFRTFPTVAVIAVPSTTLTVGQVDLYRFSVTANSTGNVGLYQFTANLATSSASTANGTTALSNVKLYAYTDAGFNNPVSNGSFTNGLLSTVATPIGGNTAFNFGAALQVPAGTTYYFRLIGTVSQVAGTTGSSGSVSAYLAGDTGFSGLMTETNVAASSTVWSANKTGSASAAGDTDWTNGYLVTGLPTLGTNIVTLSK